MALIFLFIAVLFIVVGVRGQAGQAATLLSSEFTGTNSFLPWFFAIMFIGVVGYWKTARPVSDAFLGLVLLVLFIGKGGKTGVNFFSSVASAIENAKASTTPATGPQSQCSLADDPENCLQQGVTTGPAFSIPPLTPPATTPAPAQAGPSFSSLLNSGSLNSVPVY